MRLWVRDPSRAASMSSRVGPGIVNIKSPVGLEKNSKFRLTASVSPVPVLSAGGVGRSRMSRVTVETLERCTQVDGVGLAGRDIHSGVIQYDMGNTIVPGLRINTGGASWAVI